MVFQFLKSSFSAVARSLKKTRSFLVGRLKSLFQGSIDEEKVDQLEEIFFEADFGVPLSRTLVEKTKSFLRANKEATTDEVLTFLEKELLSLLPAQQTSLQRSQNPILPTIILVVGTNGNGKTTFIAKLANQLQQEGQNVLLAASDTFRAGAQEQLDIWAKRLKVDIIAAKYGADPAACVFDAISAATSRKKDVVIIDTAGRLENKTHLMAELQKIVKACQKLVPGSPHETLLVLDATIGQNGLQLARAFKEFSPISGLVLTKIDGTAKGGAAIVIQKELGIPIKFLGTGETVNDLAAFDPTSFVHSLFFE